MSNISIVSNRLPARRQQLHQQETTRQSTTSDSSAIVSPPLYYLLFFNDNRERVILPESDIKKLVDDKAIVIIDRKKKIANIEAQGYYKNFSLKHMILIFSPQAHYHFVRECFNLNLPNSSKVSTVFFLKIRTRLTICSCSTKYG